MEKPAWIGGIKVVGWDLDGTLYPPDAVSSDMIFSKEIEAVAKQRGWDVTATEAEFRRMYAQLGSHTKTLTAMGIDGVSFFVDLWDSLDLSEFIKPDPRLVEMFDRLKHKRHFMLSNSNTNEQIEKKLQLLGVNRAVFEVVISTTAMNVVKPDPQPFAMALEKMSKGGGAGGQVVASEVLYVGDRVTTDVRGAGGVGMRTCLVWSESGEADVSLQDVYAVGELLN